LLIDSLSPLLGILGVLALFLLLRSGMNGSMAVRAASLSPSEGSVVDPGRIVIRLTGGGTIHLHGKRIELVSVRDAVADARLIRPEAGLFVAVEEGARASLIARVLDQVQAAGVADVRVVLAPESSQDEP
jgi:biopolymer transport protein ExbD